MKRAAIALLAIACGGSAPPATVTVQPLPPAPTHAEDSPAPLAQPTATPNAENAPEVLAPGKVTLVHFFASWCMPCTKSLPDLETLYASHHGRVAVVAIGEDDDEADMRSFVAHAGASYTVLWDGAKAKAGRWRLTAMPVTYVVDKRGWLRFTHVGYNDDARGPLEAEVRSLLAEP